MEKPFSESAERNKEAILNVLKEVIVPSDKLLFEVGARTAQYAQHCASYFPDLQWVLSDVAGNQAGLKLWMKDCKKSNIKGPRVFEVGRDDFPMPYINVVFTVNTLQVMSWKQNKTFFKLLGKRLRKGARVLIYGPFNVGGKFITPGNEALDRRLKEVNPQSGVRNYEDVKSGMEKRCFELLKDYDMPNNNKLLCFSRLSQCVIRGTPALYCTAK